LKRVLIAMQKKELALIAKVSAGYQSLTADGAPIISGIVVNEKAPPCRREFKRGFSREFKRGQI
jgi:hypothetical protein